MALIENMAREDLNPVEEARACAALVEELDLSKEEVARRVGRSRSAVSNLIRLLDLPDQVIELLECGGAQRGPRPGAARRQGPGRSAASSPAQAVAEGWSVRETERRAKGGGRRGTGAQGPRARIPTRRRRSARPRTRSSGRSATTSGSLRRARGLTAQIRFEDLDEVLALTKALRRK